MVLCAAKHASHIAGDPSCGGLFGIAFARWSYAPTGRRDRGFIERNPMVLCPNGAQGDSPGQSEATPWDSPLEPIILILKQSLMFSTADFVDSIVGHADPWKLRWFLSRFSTSNCTFDGALRGKARFTHPTASNTNSKFH
jgi:hypothetical protein